MVRAETLEDAVKARLKVATPDVLAFWQLLSWRRMVLAAQGSLQSNKDRDRVEMQQENRQINTTKT
jgi:hypothetical protein